MPEQALQDYDTSVHLDNNNSVEDVNNNYPADPKIDPQIKSNSI